MLWFPTVFSVCGIALLRDLFLRSYQARVGLYMALWCRVAFGNRLAVDEENIVPVATCTDEFIVPRFAVESVVAGVADEDVAAEPTVEDVVAVHAEEPVVAALAVEGVGVA